MIIILRLTGYVLLLYKHLLKQPFFQLLEMIQPALVKGDEVVDVSKIFTNNLLFLNCWWYHQLHI